MSREPATYSGIEIRWDLAAAGAALVAVAAWGSAVAPLRGLPVSVSVGAAVLAGFGFAAVALFLSIAGRTSTRPSARQVLITLVAGAIGLAVPALAIVEAGRRVDPVALAPTAALGPILLAWAARLLLDEAVTRRVLLGLTIGALGLVVIAGASLGSAAGSDPVAVVVLPGVAVVGFVAGATILKVALGTVDPRMVAWLASTGAAAGCLPFAPNLIDQLATIEPEAIVALLAMGLAPCTIGTLAWVLVLRRSSIAAAGSLAHLVPVVGILIGVASFGDAVPAHVAIGAVTVVVGVGVTTAPGLARADFERRPTQPVDVA